MLNHQNDKLIILKQEERAEMALLNDQRSNEKEIHALLQPAANEKELHASKMSKEAKNMEIL